MTPRDSMIPADLINPGPREPPREISSPKQISICARRANMTHPTPAEKGAPPTRRARGHATPHERAATGRRRTGFLAMAVVLVCGLRALYADCGRLPIAWRGPRERSRPPRDASAPSHLAPSVERGTEGDLVPLEAHIMSKCPDAKDCLQDLIVPTMAAAAARVNFTLSYIGTPTPDGAGVACLHGAPECLGNILELCAARLYPAPVRYLGFSRCLAAAYRDIPQRYLVEGCALEHGIDFAALNACASADDGALGVGLLRASVERSARAGVTKSCTVRLNEEIYCIRDGGEWTDCPQGPGVHDLIAAIEKLYRSGQE